MPMTTETRIVSTASLQREREPAGELVPDVLPRLVGVAEVAAQDYATDPLEVRDVRGPVEPELLAESLHRGRVGVPFHHADDDVAGHESHHREDDHADEQERWDRQGQPAEHVALKWGVREARPTARPR